MNAANQRPRDEAVEKIENYIISNRLQPGDKLPAERVMCELWGFNRSTLRSAIRQLIQEGKIYSKNGSGTYVAREKLIRNLQDPNGFYQSVHRAGRQIRSRLIGMERCEATKNVGRKMRLPLGHKMFRLIRLRFLDEIPVTISTIYLDAERFPALADEDFGDASLYTLLEELYGVEVVEGEEKLSIAYCDAEEAAYLEMEEGAPVIYQSGVTRDQSGAIIEYFKEITRSEYVRFGSELVRK